MIQLYNVPLMNILAIPGALSNKGEHEQTEYGINTYYVACR